MTDTIFYIVIIFIVIILFLAYLLLAYFYNSYDIYTVSTNDNFVKTKDYINNTIKILDTNMNTLNSNTNNKYTAIIDAIKNDNTTKFSNINSNIASINSNSTIIQSNILSNSNNINKFDTNIKQYIEFKDNNNSINEAIFNHTFSTIPNLSLNILRNVNAISGMTIKTDITNSNQFRICDNNINAPKCIDMNVSGNSFNIYSSDVQSNVNTIKFLGKNKKTLANFDLATNNIYLGGDETTAPLFINSNNEIFFKSINILSNNVNYLESKQFYNKTGLPMQTFNAYKYDIDDIIKSKQYINNNLIDGLYNIYKGTINNTVIINLIIKTSIPTNSTIIFDIDEIANTASNISLTFTELPSSIYINTVKLNTKTLSLTFKTAVPINTNIKIKISDSSLALLPVYTETLISNVFSAKIQ